MDSTSGNGTGWANWGHNDPDSDSSVEEDGTEDSSDIFHSAKSNISSTESASESDENEYLCCSQDGDNKEGTSEGIQGLASDMLPHNNSILDTSNGIVGIPNAQQTNVNIQNVTNFNHQQFITDDETEPLLRQTDKLMEGVNCYFDISKTKAWQSVLNTDKIVFVVGHSESFKRSISLKFFEKYRSRVEVFRLNGPEDWKICCKRSEPFAILMEDAFGPLGSKFESISHVIKNLASDENLKAALFLLDPFSFERNKESLKKCFKHRFSDYVVNLEEEDHLLSKDEKREILKKSSELVKTNGRFLTNQDIDDILGMAENPIFLDTCEEFVVYERHDENVLQLFSLPLDCLINDIKYLKEKWPDGYYVLRLVAFHEVFDESEKGELAEVLRQSIDGNLSQILNKLVGSYLKIQKNEAGDSSPKFAFQHRMMQYAVLCTETNKAFLINHCPIGFLVDVITRMTNMRKTSFEGENLNIVKRFIQEILKGKHVATVVIHEIWNSEEFLKDFKQEWEKVKWFMGSIWRSACESNILYLAVFNKSPKLLEWILKACEKQNFRVLSSSSFQKSIFATCVIGHFEHFKLLMKQMKNVDRFCQLELDHILTPSRNTENSIINFEETKCYSNITHTAVAFSRLDILNYLKSCGQNVNYTDNLSDYTHWNSAMTPSSSPLLDKDWPSLKI
ncbi:hypothetical protein LOTGIDRAFT_229903 [Lottia gigantea]|uniref:Novel STAND NTPase 3 domain-containing protein n=1 Tax=Lottia gigantea TaxID=225164 RepID=V4B384_LOTGI|nr:hypothetical protein LOTGIDRAFT_229903 [Lottia gigantea]ESP04788.1 hypothetical protein LOTGIDRAFT_229903 [Lottia gigantea]